MANRKEIILDIKVNVNESKKRLAEIAVELKRNSQLQRQYNKAIDENEKELKEGKISLTQYRQAVAQNGEALSNVRMRSSELRTEQRGLEKDLKNGAIATKAAAGSNDELRAKLSLATKELNAMSREQRNTTQKGRELQERVKKLSAELKKNESAVGDNRRNVGNYAEAAKKAIVQTFAWGGAITAITAGIAAAGRAIINFVKNSISVFSGFDRQIKTLGAVSGATASELRGLEATAKELGSTTEFTAKQVAELQTNFAKLGFSPKEIQDATAATLDLATAAGEDLARAAEIAGATVRAFNLDTSETGRVVDVMAASFSGSALDLEKFGTAMRQVAPVAAALGFSVEDTTGLLGTLANAGFDASQAGTSLRNIFLGLADANGPLATALGGSVTSVEEFVPALIKLRDSGIDVAGALEITDKRSVAAFSRFLSGAEDVKVLTDSLNVAEGAAANMAGQIRDSLSGDLDNLRSASEGLSIAFGEVLGPAIRRIVQGITFLVRGIGSLFGANQTLTDSVRDQHAEFNVQVNTLKRLNGRLGELRKQTVFTAKEWTEFNSIQSQTKKIREDLNTNYKEYLPNLLTEQDSVLKIAKAQSIANRAFEEKIRLTAAQEILTENLKKQVEAERRIFEIEADLTRAREANNVEAARNLELSIKIIRENQQQLSEEATRFQEIVGKATEIPPKVETDLVVNPDPNAKTKGEDMGKNAGEGFDDKAKQLVAGSIAFIQNEIRILNEERTQINIELNPEKLQEIDTQIAGLKAKIENAGKEPVEIPAIIKLVRSAEFDAAAAQEQIKLQTKARIAQLQISEQEVRTEAARLRLLGVEDVKETNIKLLEIQREQAGLELVFLEEDSLARAEKLREIAEIEAEIEAEKQERIKKIMEEGEEARQRDLDGRLTAAAAISKAAKDTSQAIIDIFGVETEAQRQQSEERKKQFQEQSGLVRAAIIAQKVAAGAEITINAVREISTYWRTAPATFGPILGPIIAGALSVAAVARSAGALSKIAGFAEGGPTGEAGVSDPNNPGRRIVGAVHDNEYVIPSEVLAKPEARPMVRSLEHMRKQVFSFARGGYTSVPSLPNQRRLPSFLGGGFSGVNPSSSGLTSGITTIENSIDIDGIVAAFSRMPNPVVSVKEINSVQNNVSVKERVNSI